MSPIIFLTSAETKPIACEYRKINPIKRKKKVIDFDLWVSCSYDDYQTIAEKHFFNLIPEVKSPLSVEKLNIESEVELKLRLKQKLTSEILKNYRQAEQISEYLISISNQEQKSLEYQKQDNWYCLQVKQVVADKTIGYQTLWNKIEPDKSKQKSIDKQRRKSPPNFWTEEQINEQWEETGEKISGFFDELIDTFDRGISKINKETKTISQVVKDFCLEDNWDYLQLNDGITLQLTCQGNNGQITCYARSYNQQNQFIFYSLYPQVIPPDKCETIALLITKINYGMIIGNFEIDLNDGELRYKTSIDVENDRLSTALVKKLIYNNVLTIDRYLPAINNVLNEEYTIDEAIKRVESES